MLKHKYLSIVKKLKLFKGVKSFEEIEKQISEHSDLEKGDAFEVFAEAYLTLGLNAPHNKVIPENKLTIKHFNRLQITASDTNVKGIDGVLETSTNEFHTYQVKFRTSTEKLYWNQLVGSIAASDRIDALLIFTNVKEIDGDIRRRRVPVYTIKQDKLNELTQDDLKRIENLIYKDQVKKKREIKLDSYQKDAIKDVLNKLETKPRTQLIMPCGSGKTIVGQRIVESMDNTKTILILVPTLQLLNDTFENYFNDTLWDSFPYICVGSKVVDSRSYDQMDADPSELPMVTCTDPETVKAFLAKKFNKYIIFSTYQSLPVVAKAFGDKSVDIAIFDEAHNTASKEGNYWTFGLADKNIKINKRIFMTATPRKYHLRRKNEEDMRISYSMDNPAIFGQAAYKMSFKKAADEYGAICRYKIIISVLTSEYFSREDLRDGDVLLGYNDVNAENIAKQIALQDAVKKNRIKKIISFHPSINHSENFVGETEISIKNRLKDFEVYNVSSRKTMSIRRSTMREFRKAKTALISNAQCLNEGVDIPAVDMVAFMHPKKSTVSIVQAVGRAIRKPRGSNKEWGYVFVPIFLEKAKGETDIEAAERSNFNDIYEVINALRDHDEVLDDIIYSLRFNKGYKGKISYEDLNDYIQINGLGFSIEHLEKFIHSEIVDRMTSNSVERFGCGIRLLKDYIDTHGNSWVPQKLIIDDFFLGSWVSDLRNNYNFKISGKMGVVAKKMMEKQIPKLESIPGWVWRVEEEKLEIVLEALMEYYLQFGDYNIYQGGRILDKGIEFYIEHKELNVTARLEYYKTNHKKWVEVGKDHNKMPLNFRFPKYVLDGFNILPEWTWEDRYDIVWNEKFELFKNFKEEKNHVLVKQKHNVHYPGLFSWVNRQRLYHKQNKLSNEQYELLVKEGFDFDPHRTVYKKNIEKLNLFKKKHGHCNVPQKYPILGNFVTSIRGKYRNRIEFPDKKFRNPLTQNDIDELIEMGFEFVSPNLSVKHGLEKFQEIAKKKGGECLSTKYAQAGKNLDFKCSNASHPQFSTQPQHILNGSWCSLCYKDEVRSFKNKTINDMKDFAQALAGKCLSEKYRGRTSTLLWECKNKHRWHETPWQVVRNKKWCKDCNENP